MQVDTESTFADQVLPALLDVPPPTDPLAAQALALLRTWDGGMRRDRPEPLILNAWIKRFRDKILARAGVPAASAGPMEEFVGFVLSPAGRHWCGETCGPISSAALQETVTDLKSKFGNDVSAWEWGKAHPAVFAHPILGRLPLVGSLATARIEIRATVRRSIGAKWPGRVWKPFTALPSGACTTSPISTAACSSLPPASPATCSAHMRGLPATLARWRYRPPWPNASDRLRNHQARPAMNSSTWNSNAHSLVREDDDFLTEGVLTRRCVAWCLDLVLIGILVSTLWFVLFAFGVVSSASGCRCSACCPWCRSCITSAPWPAGVRPPASRCGPRGAEQQRSEAPERRSGAGIHARLLSDLRGVWRFAAGVRPVHDPQAGADFLLSGLVVIRRRALTPPSGSWNMPGGPSY